MKQYLRGILKILFSSFVVQGICLLASFPILYYWGLPSSIAALPCNIIFAPVAALYLSLCAIFFLQSMLGFFIPGFSSLLTKISELWLIALEFPSKFKVLFSPSNTDFLAWIGALLLVTTIWAIRPKRTKLALAFLPQLLVIFCLIRPLLSRQERLVLNSSSGSLTIASTKDGQLSIEDQGYFYRQPVQSTLLNKVRPAVLSQFGQRKLKHYNFYGKSKKANAAKHAAFAIFK
jgi:hypothetical protein